MKRTEYEKEWGKSYQKPGCGAHVLALVFKLIPKVGPFKAIAFKMPNPETETQYLQSVNSSVEQYGIYLRDLKAGKLALENRDFDTGKPTTAGEYRLTDEAYATLLNKLTDDKFSDTTLALQQNILAFYAPPAAPIFDKKKPEKREKTLRSLEELRALGLEKIATR